MSQARPPSSILCQPRAGVYLHDIPAAGDRAGALASIRHLKQSRVERERLQQRAATLKRRLVETGLPVTPSESHILPVMVGDPRLCKAACDELLQRHRIYVQPINYPTVPRGTERLRITPTPFHNDALVKELASALVAVWNRLDLPLFTDSEAEPPRVAAAGNARVAVFPPAGG